MFVNLVIKHPHCQLVCLHHMFMEMEAMTVFSIQLILNKPEAINISRTLADQTSML